MRSLVLNSVSHLWGTATLFGLAVALAACLPGVKPGSDTQATDGGNDAAGDAAPESCSTPGQRADDECDDEDPCTVDMCSEDSSCANVVLGGFLQELRMENHSMPEVVSLFNSADVEVDLAGFEFCVGRPDSWLCEAMSAPTRIESAELESIDASGLDDSLGAAGGEFALLPPDEDFICDYVAWGVGDGFAPVFVDDAVALGQWVAGEILEVSPVTRSIWAIESGMNDSPDDWWANDEDACTADDCVSGVCGHSSVRDAIWHLRISDGEVVLVNAAESLDGSLVAVNFEGFQLCSGAEAADCVALTETIDEEEIGPSVAVAGLGIASGELALIPSAQDPSGTATSLTVCDYVQWGADVGSTLGEEAEADGAWSDDAFVAMAPGAFDLAGSGFDASNDAANAWDSDPCTAAGCADGLCEHFELDDMLFGLSTGGTRAVRFQHDREFAIDLTHHFVCVSGLSCEPVTVSVAPGHGGVQQTLLTVVPADAATGEGEFALAATNTGSIVCDYVAYASDSTLDSPSSLQSAAVSAGQWQTNDETSTGTSSFRACDADNNEPAAWRSDAFCRGVFVTAAPWTGTSGGIAGADAHCMADAKRPAGQTFQAMIVDGTARVACSTPNCVSDEGVDWVFGVGGVHYIRLPDRAHIGATAAGGNLGDLSMVSLDAAFSATSVQIWTGLNSDWTSSAADCDNWSSSAMSATGAEGGGQNVGVTALNDGSASACDATDRHLICVEQ